jgi:hypothetical protein
VAIDPQVLLVLLAVRARGGRAPATAEEFKALKKAVALARSQGWIEEQQAEITITSKAGKATKKKAPVLSLSAAGNQVLHQAANPEALAATASQNAQNLHKALENDRQTLRQEVLAALSAKGKGKGTADPAKDLQAIIKNLTELSKRLENLEKALQRSADTEILAKIDRAFDALQAKLAPASSHAAGPTKAPTQHTPPSSLRDTLHQAYQTLCQYFEFEDGLVKMPNLYHEARKKMPSLTVEAFHRELESLWTRRVLELKVLNEVRSATEPDKGIRRDDNLYYFVYWPSP